MLDRLWPPSGRLTAAEVVLQALVVQGKDGVDDVGHKRLKAIEWRLSRRRPYQLLTFPAHFDRGNI